MRKWCLALALLLSFVFSACASSGPAESSGSVETSGGSHTAGSEGKPSTLPVIAMSDLHPVGAFHEGLLFVERKSDGAVYCIDKDGQIRFRLPEGYVPDSTFGGRFYNGLAVVQAEGPEGHYAVLCQTDGTILTPQQFGGAQFLFSQTVLTDQQQRFFADGYIMVAAEGQLGLLSSELEWIVPMSAEYASMIGAFVEANTEEGFGTEFYYDAGRFVTASGYVDVRTGHTGDTEQVKELLTHPSEFWVEWRDSSTIMFQDALSGDGAMALQLSGWLEDGDQIPSFTFEEGSAGVVTVREEGNTFTVIDESGKRLFDPVKVYGDEYSYDCASGIYCVSGIDAAGDLLIQLFDVHGAVDTYLYDVPDDALHSSATVEDGTILVCVRYSEELQDAFVWELFDLKYDLLY